MKVPLDFREAHERYGAMCGHGAFAAALGKSVRDACLYFEQEEPRGPLPALARRWVNIPQMRAALAAAEVFSTDSKPRWPGHGLAIVQFMGPWCAPGVPAAAACQHTHWVAHVDGQVWDINLDEDGWIPFVVWQLHYREDSPGHLLPKRSTGIALKRGFEIRPRPDLSEPTPVT